MDAVVDAELQVVHHRVGVGEVHDDLGTRGHEGVGLVVGVDHGHQLGVIGRLDRPAHLGTDPAASAQDAHLESHAVQASDVAQPTAPSPWRAWVRDAGT